MLAFYTRMTKTSTRKHNSTLEEHDQELAFHIDDVSQMCCKPVLNCLSRHNTHGMHGVHVPRGICIGVKILGRNG